MIANDPSLGQFRRCETAPAGTRRSHGKPRRIGANRARRHAMSIEFIGMIHHRHASEIHPPGPAVLDRGYIRDFAQAAEKGGFDRLLVGYHSDAPDGFLVAASAASHTDR